MPLQNKDAVVQRKIKKNIYLESVNEGGYIVKDRIYTYVYSYISF